MGDIEMQQEVNTSGSHTVVDSLKKSLTDVVSKRRRRDPPTIYKVPQTIRHLEDYVQEIEVLEDKARSCYSENVGPVKEFVKMMVLDGCFIVELFLKLNQVKEIQEEMGKVDDGLFNVELSLKLNQKEELKKKEKLKQKMEELSLKQQKLYQSFDGSYLSNLKDNVQKHYENKWNMWWASLKRDYFTNPWPVISFIAASILLIFTSIQTFYTLKDYVKAIEELEDKARNCYSNNVGRQMGNEFVEMMVLDGCFIVELFLKLNQVKEIQEEMEKRIFKMVSPVDGSLTEFALDFFKDFLQRNEEILLMDSYHHPLHLLHSHVIPSEESFPRNPNKWKKQLMFLRSRGVKFKKKEIYSSILDVKFSNGVLEIPPLVIDDFANTLFRNLIAFEQCYPNAKICITTYLSLMDCLIDTSKDVALLHRNRIIDHLQGRDEDVATLFNQLGIGTIDSYDDNYLSNLYKDVETHYNTRWNMWWASLRRNYFTNPWSGLSSIAAMIILVTITQTFFTVFSYYRARGPGS
ncbi:UPF0481 protein At3g47200-like [Magnolia sinica]|uniref:UPF0481 protein At3g47200-like n=1 Tax=Magnolia sinica TaxID=86752 RepID=UPI002658375A|nr:UPF0481 protein At3g47200-like [Magnolia sinica]